MFAPASLIVFFHDGPLAWNGIIAWWLTLTTFFLWIVVTSWVLVNAIKQQAPDATDLDPMWAGELPRYEELVTEVARLHTKLAASLQDRREHDPAVPKPDKGA